MYNWHFKISVDNYDDDAYVVADDYDTAVQKLINNYEFNNYRFEGATDLTTDNFLI